MTENNATHRGILIVEDRLSIAIAMRSMFQRNGWDVTIARTGAEAIQALVLAPDRIVCNAHLANGQADPFLHTLAVRRVKIPVVILLDHAEVNRGIGADVDSLNAGFVFAPIDFRAV